MGYSIGLRELKDRFWYWSGASGKRYIHSVYPLDACPPLPGAIFTLVRCLPNGERIALEVGRFNENWDYIDAMIADKACGINTADEIHVHLLASSSDNADTITRDLERAINRTHQTGCFQESAPLLPFSPMADMA